jgi:hypothetical protein
MAGSVLLVGLELPGVWLVTGLLVGACGWWALRGGT